MRRRLSSRPLWAGAYRRPGPGRIWFRKAKRGSDEWDLSSLRGEGAQEAEAQVVIAVRRVVPVAVGGTAVVRVVVPVTTPVDAVRPRLFSIDLKHLATFVPGCQI
ncbi:MAG: hypothetical protein WA705_19320 [Candidatus Ozemobacteraceae bacterium]